MIRKILTLSICSLLSLHSKSQEINPWIIQASEINADKYYGITSANGSLGIISSPEPFKVKEVVLAGAFDTYGRGRVSNFIKSFNLLNCYVEIDGKGIYSNNISNYKQQFNTKNGIFSGSFDVGDKVSITYSYCALRHLPYSALMDITVKAKKKCKLKTVSILETPEALRDAQNYFNQIDRPLGLISLLTSTAKSPTGKLLMCASNSYIFNEGKGTEPQIIHSNWDSHTNFMEFSKDIEAGQTYNYAIVGSSITSAQHPDPYNEAERLTIFAKVEGKEKLLKNHNKAWAQLWESDITIEGDSQAQQDIHNMLYHLYAFSREGNANSPSPMGLSGLGYNGHVFWDTEIWMLPPVLLLQPALAKSMLDYRFNRLEMAKANAYSHGFKGAMFPWESAETGAEETPVWALSGPFEHHITADVASAAWKYFCVTQDKEWLKTIGYPIISACADFWASRVERNGPGRYDINNVVCADEFAEGVDNNAYTNAAAKANLSWATDAAKVLGIKPNDDWMIVAKNIPILKFVNGVTREHSTYNGEGIKQADVNLLAYPLSEISDPNQIKKDLEYYQVRVPHEDTPAMTQAIFTTLYSRLGDADKADFYFKDSYLYNLNPPFRVIAETKGGTNPYFATGAGGIMQSILMGFTGLEITNNGVTQIKSSMPKHWKKITVTGVGPNKKTFQKTTTNK